MHRPSHLRIYIASSHFLVIEKQSANSWRFYEKLDYITIILRILLVKTKEFW